MIRVTVDRDFTGPFLVIADRKGPTWRAVPDTVEIVAGRGDIVYVSMAALEGVGSRLEVFVHLPKHLRRLEGNVDCDSPAEAASAYADSAIVVCPINGTSFGSVQTGRVLQSRFLVNSYWIGRWRDRATATAVTKRRVLDVANMLDPRP